jgi:uncharacterized protein YhhL (DUF1145 family)
MTSFGVESIQFPVKLLPVQIVWMSVALNIFKTYPKPADIALVASGL